MQLYRGSASSFIETTKQNQIALKLKEVYFNHFGFYTSVYEEMSWRNSLRAINNHLRRGKYRIPVICDNNHIKLCSMDNR